MLLLHSNDSLKLQHVIFFSRDLLYNSCDDRGVCDLVLQFVQMLHVSERLRTDNIDCDVLMRAS